MSLSPDHKSPALEPGVSVVIPVYQSAKILPTLVSEIAGPLAALKRPFEVILVIDGSPDDSGIVAADLSTHTDWLHSIQLTRNYGQHNALLAGIRAAKYDTTITMDDDLQHPPSQLANLLQALTLNIDVVYGYPKRQTHGLARDMASWVTKLILQRAMGAETAKNISAFRAFRTRVREGFAGYNHPFVNLDVLLTWGTNRFSAIAIDHAPRREGVSNYTFGKLIKHSVNMLTGFSVLPLQIASLVGFTFTLFGIVILFYVIAIYMIKGGSVPGFPFLASMIALFAGAQLFALGIMGEYLARIHFRSMNKPSYVIAPDNEPS